MISVVYSYRNIIFFRSIIAITSILLLAGNISYADEEPAETDSPGARFSAVIRNDLEMRRGSSPYRWNSVSDSTRNRGIASLLASDRKGGISDLFLKVRSERVESVNRRNSLYISQGEFSVNPYREKIHIRYFLRERVHYSRFKLLPTISSDSPYLNRNSEGISTEIKPLDNLLFSYTGTRLSSSREADDNSGLPFIRGEVATMHRVSADFSMIGMYALGVELAEIKPLNEINNSVVGGLRGLVRIGNGNLFAEYSEAVPGVLSDLTPGSFKGLSPAEIDEGSVIDIFPSASAFSTEFSSLNILSVDMIGGYRYFGPGYPRVQGDIRRAVSERYLHAIWRHPSRELTFDIRGGDIYYFDDDNSSSYIQGFCRVYLRQGVELRGTVTAPERVKPSAAISFRDDGRFSNLECSVRIGNGDRLSFVSDGSVNLSDNWTAGCRLYLYRSNSSRYSMNLSYRSSRRFLFRISAGSFNPYGSMLSFERDILPELPPENRFINIFARVRFGEVGD